MLKNANGYKFAGPAVVSIFEEKIMELAGIGGEDEDGAEDSAEDGADGAGDEDAA